MFSTKALKHETNTFKTNISDHKYIVTNIKIASNSSKKQIIHLPNKLIAFKNCEKASNFTELSNL